VIRTIPFEVLHKRLFTYDNYTPLFNANHCQERIQGRGRTDLCGGLQENVHHKKVCHRSQVPEEPSVEV
jgi:hypothetical protein